MGDLAKLTLDLVKITERISATLGHPASAREVTNILTDRGIVPSGTAGEWVAYASELEYFEPDEILAAEPYQGRLPKVDSEPESWAMEPEPPTSTLADAMMPIPTDEFWIPSCLIGTTREVDLRLKALAKRTVKLSDWGKAVAGMELVHIDNAPGKLLLDAPSPFFEKGDHVHLYEMNQILMYATERPDRHEWYRTQRVMTLRGLDYFWFCLTGLNSVDLIFLQDGTDDPQGFAREALPKLLRWWEKFSLLNKRFSVGLPEGVGTSGHWPFWGAQVYRFCRELGMSEQDLDTFEALDPMAAGRHVERWLKTAAGVSGTKDQNTPK